MNKLTFILSVLLVIQIFFFFFFQTNNIKLKIQEIRDSHLAKITKGSKIIHLSDLHIKRYGSREKRLVKLLKSINADIIFITGDFISKNRGIKPCTDVINAFKGDSMVIGILGNSDHSYGSESIDTDLLVGELKRIGVVILINQSNKLTFKSDGDIKTPPLYIVGLDDNFLNYDNIFRAGTNVPQDSTRILLAHSPHIIEKIDTKGINLVLSGHTHGGQIVIPFIGPVYTNDPCRAKKRYVSGLYEDDEYTKLYVNRGIGTSNVPIRMFCRPEITLIKFI
jgi:predicted MPP superfamily phosphohydrolase